MTDLSPETLLKIALLKSTALLQSIAEGEEVSKDRLEKRIRGNIKVLPACPTCCGSGSTLSGQWEGVPTYKKCPSCEGLGFDPKESSPSTSGTPAPWSKDFDHNKHDRDDYWKTLKAGDIYFCVLGEGSEMLDDTGYNLVAIIPVEALKAGESIYEWEFDWEHVLKEEHRDKFTCCMEGVWEFDGTREECHQLLSEAGLVFNPKILDQAPDQVPFKP